MTNWKYGDSWEKYPIEEGELWQAINGSKLMVNDLTKNFPSFLKEADMVYSDPPWNRGNVNSFYTKANKQDEHIKDFKEFYFPLFETIKKINPKVCYVEAGFGSKDEYREELEKIFPIVQTWEITYYKKNKCYLIRGGHKEQKFDFSGFDDNETPLLAMQNEEFECVADVCMGLGTTALSAQKLNKKFVGTELNKRRLAVTINNLNQNGLLMKKI